MKAETKLQIFINHELQEEITICVNEVFSIDINPEISYSLLRECISKLKKKHKKLYQEYMESDVE